MTSIMARATVAAALGAALAVGTARADDEDWKTDYCVVNGGGNLTSSATEVRGTLARTGGTSMSAAASLGGLRGAGPPSSAAAVLKPVRIGSAGVRWNGGMWWIGGTLGGDAWIGGDLRFDYGILAAGDIYVRGNVDCAGAIDFAPGKALYYAGTAAANCAGKAYVHPSSLPVVAPYHTGDAAFTAQMDPTGPRDPVSAAYIEPAYCAAGAACDVVLAPGTHGFLKGSNNGTGFNLRRLYLRGGDYYFNNIDLTSNAGPVQIELDLSSGQPVRIFTRNGFNPGPSRSWYACTASAATCAPPAPTTATTPVPAGYVPIDTTNYTLPASRFYLENAASWTIPLVTGPLVGTYVTFGTNRADLYATVYGRVYNKGAHNVIGSVWCAPFPVVASANTPPTITAIVWPPDGARFETCAGQPALVSFAASASDPDPGDTLDYAWRVVGGGIDTTLFAARPFLFLPAGTYRATVTVTDQAGASASAARDFEVVVERTPPLIACPGERTLELPQPVPADYLATAKDMCGPPTIAVSPADPAGATLDYGFHPFVFTATDSAGNRASCTSSITMLDYPPEVVCPADTLVAADASCRAELADVCPGEGPDDACSSRWAPVQSPAAGAVLDGLGASTVTVGVTNADGVGASCATQVTVVDETPPALACPAAMIVDTAPGRCDAAPSFAATASDNCAAAVEASCLPASGATLPLGTTAITCEASDGTNHGSCATEITVRDAEPPAIACPDEPYLVAGAECAVAEIGFPQVSDNCGGTEVAAELGGPYGLGEHAIRWSATDGAGNGSACVQRFTVLTSADVRFLPPLAGTPVANRVQAPRQSVPVKVAITDCGGGSLTAGVIAYLRVEGVVVEGGDEVVFQDVVEDANGAGLDGTDTSDGVMQLVDGAFQLNLSTAGFADLDTASQPDRYYRATVIVTDAASGAELGTRSIVLETGKR